jgi:two-component system OmpR family response regulator
MATAIKSTTRRILVVDDDPDIVALVSDLLRANGYDVATAPDGLEGILSGSGGAPLDLVILDVMMPKADGIGVLNALKAIRPGMPIILLTAKTAPEDVAAGYDWGCDAYVTKPFEPEDLLVEVRRALDPAPE